LLDNRILYRRGLQALHAYDLNADWYTAAGFTQFARVQRYTAAGWLVSCPQETVLCTAGTVGPDTLPRFALQWLDHVDFRQVDIGGGMLVHQLWDARAAGYSIDVVNALAAMGETSCHLVGHSYGAALSLLLVRHLEAAGVTVQSVTTFGCPKVGNGTFTASLTPPVLRVERDSDVVPWVPLSTPMWLLGLAWASVLGAAGLFLPHGPFATSYASAGSLVWCGDETDPPRLVTSPLELVGLQLQRSAELISNLVVPRTAFRLAAGHLMERYASHVSIPVP